jgi:hypothetical protein
MTRREDFSLLGELVGIPKIHEPNFTERPPELEALKDINNILDESFLEFTNQYVGSNHGIETFQQILNHTSLFYNLYLRVISKNDKYMRSFKYQKSKQTEEEIEEFEISPHPRISATITTDSDERGRLPALGRWQVSGEKTVYHHKGSMNRGRNDIDLHDYYKEWNDFIAKYALDATLSIRDCKDTLRGQGFGELQVWMFWRYFTGRKLDCNQWALDLPLMHSFYGNNDDQTRNEYGTRVWNSIGGVYDAKIEKLNLSSPEKNLPCAYPLGCVQNIDCVEAPFSNRLSWEHEHSRPRRWGGSDTFDTQVMCTHHNRMKGDGFIFDVKTLSKIIMIHRVNCLLEE